MEYYGFSIGYFFNGFGFFEIFLFSLASLVAGIPEGLPSILAIVLSTSFFQGIFQFGTLTIRELLTIIILFSLVLWVGEIHKFIVSWSKRKKEF